MYKEVAIMWKNKESYVDYGGVFGLSIIKHIALQKIVAHDFRYDPRNLLLSNSRNINSDKRNCLRFSTAFFSQLQFWHRHLLVSVKSVEKLHSQVQQELYCVLAQTLLQLERHHSVDVDEQG